MKTTESEATLVAAETTFDLQASDSAKARETREAVVHEQQTGKDAGNELSSSGVCRPPSAPACSDDVHQASGADIPVHSDKPTSDSQSPTAPAGIREDPPTPDTSVTASDLTGPSTAQPLENTSQTQFVVAPAPPLPTKASTETQDPRPRIPLAGENRMVSEVALDMGQVLAAHDIYLLGGEVVVYNAATGTLAPLKSGKFRTWLEQYIIPTDKAGDRKTISNGEATAVLLSEQFREQLREVQRQHAVRLPVMRSSGTVELLPLGYDKESKILTARSGIDYRNDLPLHDAAAFLRKLLKDFPFADDSRSMGVVVAGMVSVFGLALLKPKTIVPVFEYRGNLPGLGKGLLVQLALIPVLGYAPTGVNPKDDTEMRKLLLAVAKAGQLVLLFDNLKGNLSSGPLESFLTTSTVSGRAVGTSDFAVCHKQIATFLTGNVTSMSRDMARRTIRAELFLDSPPEKRTIGSYLDENRILELRPNILAALYALVRDWNAAGRPGPSVINPSFSGWSEVIGGIVEFAGFGCVCTPSTMTVEVDHREADMAKLIDTLYDQHRTAGVTFTRVIEIARMQKLFRDILHSEVGPADRQERTALGRLFSSYHERFFAHGHQFVCIGAGHARRYAVRLSPDAAIPAAA